MGSQPSKIKCFNELNTRYYKTNINFNMKTHECKSGLDATFLREFPPGCFTYVCENCYYNHYTPELLVGIDPLKVAKKRDDIEFEHDVDTYTYYSNIPKREDEMEMIDQVITNEGDENENKNYIPVWKEYVSGVIPK